MHLNFPVSLGVQMVLQTPAILLQYAVDIAQGRSIGDRFCGC